MRIDRKSPRSLAAFLQNLTTLLAGPKLTALDPAVRAELLAELGSLPATIESKQDATEELAGQLKASYTSRDESITFGVAAGRRVRKYLESADAPEEQWELCGFNKPGARRTAYIAEKPTNLQVSAYSNGAIKGKFRGNNKSGAVFYEVYRRTGLEEPWALYISVKETRFVDEDVTFDGSYWYMVRAKASKNASMFSSVVVVNPR